MESRPGDRARRLLCPTLVGRDVELRRLVELVDASRTETGTLVLVAGDAGVGKTALVGRLVESARARGIRTFQAACTDVDARRPFGPLLDIAGPATPSSDATSRAASGAGPAFEIALTGRILELGRERPALLVIEDLQWADPATTALLPHVARRIRDVGVVLLATYRSDEMHRRHPLRPLLAELTRGRLAEHLTVGPLNESDTVDFIRETLGSTRTPDLELCRVLHRVCGGNPFHMEEVLRSLADRGDLALRDGVWHSPRAALALALPESLRDAVLQRFRSLPEPSQRMLQIAALIGQEFDFELLHDVTASSEDDLIATLRAGIEAQLLLEVTTGTRSDRYAFRHALTREAVGLELLARERRRLHGSIARALEARAGAIEGSARQLAYHFDEAGDAAQARRYHEMASAQAIQTYAYRVALEHQERALALCEADDPRLAELHLELARTARLASDHRATIRAAEIAREAYAAAADRSGAAEAIRLMSVAHWMLGEGERASAEAAEAVRLLQDAGDERALAAALADVARVESVLGRGGAAIPAAERAVEIARRSDLPEVEVDALVSRGTSLAHACTRASTAALREAVDRGLSLGVVNATARGLNNLHSAYVRCRAPAVEQRRTTQALAEFDARHGMERVSVVAREMAIAVLDGEWEVGLRRAADARGDGLFPSYVRLHEAFMLVGRFGPAALGDLLDAPLRMRTHIGWNTRHWLIALALQALVLAERYADGLRIADEELESVRTADLHPAVDGTAAVAIDAARLLHDRAAEDRWIDAVLAAAPSIPVEVDARRAYATAERAASDGDTDTALAQFERAARIFGDELEQFSAYPRASISRRLIELHLGRGLHEDRDLAQAEFDRSIAFWTKAKATWYLDRLTAWARPLGLRFDAVPSPRAPKRALLTAREREIAALIAEGLSNKDIGSRLTISERTAEGHVERIRAKLGFHSRAQIAAWHAQLAKESA